MSSREPQTSEARSRVWYADGLRFTCTQCCRCCTGPPGYVWVTPVETARMAAYLGVSADRFDGLYCRSAWLRVSLTERENGDCVFLTPKGCAVYPARPNQCRTFPFWADNLQSRRRWDSAAGRCPGVGRGRLYSVDEIERIAADGQST